MIYLSANATTLKLAAPVGIGTTTITLEAGGGAKWPAIIPGSGFALQVTLMDAATGVITEIVTVTAHTANSDVLTVLRGQEGTTQKAYLVGDFAALIPTNAVSNNVIQPGRGAQWYPSNDPVVNQYLTLGPNISNPGGECRICIDTVRREIQMKGILRANANIGNGTVLCNITPKRFDGTQSTFSPYTPYMSNVPVNGATNAYAWGYTEISIIGPGASGVILFSGLPISAVSWVMLDLTIMYI